MAETTPLLETTPLSVTFYAADTGEIRTDLDVEVDFYSETGTLIDSGALALLVGTSYVFTPLALSLDAVGEYQAIFTPDVDDGNIAPVVRKVVLQVVEGSYQAKLWLTDDNNDGFDHYVAVWFKDGEPYTGTITSPTIKVIRAADGSTLIAQTAMSVIATGMYRYSTSAARIADGAAYIATITATIDGAARTWIQPISRDSQ